MWYVGIDLHREFVVIAAVRDNGEIMEPGKIVCREREAIGELIRSLVPFRRSSKPVEPIAGFTTNCVHTARFSWLIRFVCEP